jgi:hypothetical protein
VNELKLLLAKVIAFEQDAHAILATHEAAGSRVIVLEESYDKLTKLSLRQDELFRQALRCVEHKLYRAAHVLAWAGFMDLLEEKIASDGLVRLRLARAGWKSKNMEEIRETYAEYQIIEVARDVDLCTKTQMKALHGMLNKRNECAHPSDFYPDVNDTLGYVSELLSRVAILQTKTL